MTEAMYQIIGGQISYLSLKSPVDLTIQAMNQRILIHTLLLLFLCNCTPVLVHTYISCYVCAHVIE